jgi:hypothetical protein
MDRLKIQIGETSQPSFVSSTYFTTPTSEDGNGENPLNNPKKVHVAVVTDLRHPKRHLEIETGYGYNG